MNFRIAALQFSIRHELSSGKLGMHKQGFFFLSSRGLRVNAVAKLIFSLLPVPLQPEADKQAKDRRESAGEEAREVEEF